MGLSKDCPLRPSAELDELEKKKGNPGGMPATIELEPEDLEEQGCDEGVGEEEGEEREPAQEEEFIPDKPASRDCIVDLWPFAFAKDYYKRMLSAFTEDASNDEVVGDEL